jgi:hypothetical protein
MIKEREILVIKPSDEGDIAILQSRRNEDWQINHAINCGDRILFDLVRETYGDTTTEKTS